MFEKQFRITNLNCEACVKLSTAALKDLPGVTDVSVDLKTGQTTLHAEREVAREEIVKSLEEVNKTTDL